MAVNLPAPRAGRSASRPGRAPRRRRRAHVRKPNRKDLLLVALDEGCRVAGVFTRNQFAAAPVQVCRANLEDRAPTSAPSW